MAKPAGGTLRMARGTRHDEPKKRFQGEGLREGPTVRCGAKQATPSAFSQQSTVGMRELLATF